MARTRTFSTDKDEVLKQLPDVDLGGDRFLELKVCSYDDGEPKLQVSRKKVNADSGEAYFSKLGRLTQSEAFQLGTELVRLSQDPETWRRA